MSRTRTVSPDSSLCNEVTDRDLRALKRRAAGLLAAIDRIVADRAYRRQRARKLAARIVAEDRAARRGSR